jgi:hypothetical protein
MEKAEELKFQMQFMHCMQKMHKDRHIRQGFIQVQRFDSVIRCRGTLDEDNKKPWENIPVRFTTWTTPEVAELKNQIYFETKNTHESVETYSSGVLDLPKALR